MRLAPNGCFILCPERDAQGISFAGEVYHLFGRNKIGKESVLLERIDSGGVLFDMDSRLADTDAMTVDQEYRITLLELGITEFDEEEI